MEGLCLIVAEKPSVAKNYAAALGCEDSHRTYLEGNGYLISWCIGHLVEPVKPEVYDGNLKKWTYEALPIIPEQWQYAVKKETKAQFETLKKLMNREDVESVVCGTDAGREGELIFRLVYEQAGCTKPMKRLWISSMEAQAIVKGMENLQPGSVYENLYQSAICRQKADWIVGINGTRLFTVLCGGRVLKVGRVQTPTLSMIVEREDAIRNFQKEPFYLVHLLRADMDFVSERITDRLEADVAAAECKGEMAQVTAVRREKKSVTPPKLYDLTSLQRDANRKYGFTAKQTLEYVQSLYEKKLATYPRTDSRYLTEDMRNTAVNVIWAVFKTIFGCEIGDFQPDVEKVMDNGKVTDHHAIIPTIELLKINLEELPENEQKILTLIGSRLVCASAEKHIYESIVAEVSCKEHIFKATAKKVISEGWKRFEGNCGRRDGSGAEGEKGSQELKDQEILKKQEELNEQEELKQQERNKKKNRKKQHRKGSSAPALLSAGALAEKSQSNHTEHHTELAGMELSKIKEGMFFVADDVRLEMDYTKPLQHFTEDSLLSAMERAGAKDTDDQAERKGLGTPATRADIIEKLVHDGFIRRNGKQLTSTEDGRNLIRILPEEIKSPKLTADWENALVQVAKGELHARVFMDGICDMVERLIEDNKVIAGEKKALFADAKGRNSQRLGNCPKCGKDVLAGKFGAYCSGKCGMSVGIALGKKLDDSQVKLLLDGKKIFVKGLKSKKGSPYAAYLVPKGVEDYHYTKDGKEHEGYRWRFDIEFPD